MLEIQPVPCWIVLVVIYPQFRASEHFLQLQVIVKSGDDCRQEHLAVQLVAHFYGKRKTKILS